MKNTPVKASSEVSDSQRSLGFFQALDLFVFKALSPSLSQTDELCCNVNSKVVLFAFVCVCVCVFTVHLCSMADVCVGGYDSTWRLMCG